MVILDLPFQKVVLIACSCIKYLSALPVLYHHNRAIVQSFLFSKRNRNQRQQSQIQMYRNNSYLVQCLKKYSSAFSSEKKNMFVCTHAQTKRITATSSRKKINQDVQTCNKANILSKIKAMKCNSQSNFIFSQIICYWGNEVLYIKTQLLMLARHEKGKFCRNICQKTTNKTEYC